MLVVQVHGPHRPALVTSQPSIINHWSDCKGHPAHVKLCWECQAVHAADHCSQPSL